MKLSSADQAFGLALSGGQKMNRNRAEGMAAPGSLRSNPDRLFSRPEVSAYIGLSLRFLEVSATRGDGPPMTKVGRRAMYRAEDLADWLDSRRVRSTSEQPK